MAPAPHERPDNGIAESPVSVILDRSAEYDALYFNSHCGPVPYNRSEPQWAAMFGSVADNLIRAFRPTRVLDLGCALGFLVEAFWDRGVQAWGRDISAYAIANVRADVREYCSIRSATEPIDDGPFDLITCIEVLEHVSEDEAFCAIANMASATDLIIFSSSPYNVSDPAHVNVRPLLWWLSLFERHGFNPDILYDASFIAPHAIAFRRAERPLGAEVHRLFASLLNLRHENGEQRSRRKESDAALASARAELELESDRSARFKNDLLSAEKALREVRLASDRLVDQLTAELSATKRALQQTQISRDGLQDQLTATAEQMASYLEFHERHVDLFVDSPSLSAIQGRIASLEHQGHSLLKTASAQTSELVRLEANLIQTNEVVGGILHSRIWRALVSGSKWVGRLLPGGRQDGGRAS